MADRFEELRIFVAVAEAGGVNAGAARLGLAKSAVSRRISLLEERLGVDLLLRETRRFTLTPAGLNHLARAKILLAELDDLDQSTAAGGRARPLTISAPAELAVHVVAPALADLAQRAPDVAFRLSAGAEPADVILEIAATTGRRKVDAEIGRVAFARYAAPSRAHDARTSGSSIGVSAPPTWFVGAGARESGQITVGTLDMALAAAVAGAGIVTLPDFMAAAAVAAGILVMLEEQPAGSAAAITATAATGVDAAELLAEIAARLAPS